MRGFLVFGFGMVGVLELGRVIGDNIEMKWNEFEGIVLWVLY